MPKFDGSANSPVRCVTAMKWAYANVERRRQVTGRTS
jgi:hypothetical protein